MTLNGWMQIALFSAALLLVTKPMGLYLTAVFEGRIRWFAPIERFLLRVAGVSADDDQHWTRYAGSLLMFSVAGMLLTYAVLRLQAMLPLNPAGLPAVPDRQAFETAASFLTNTNWQSYAGESMMSYLSQMTQLAYHNFVSAAAGLAVAVALVRGIARRGDGSGRVGNFWSDLVRGTLLVLLPLSLVLSLLFVQQGVPQTFDGPVTATTVEGATQTLALGPVASQEAIKQLGTNGGGFFNANAAMEGKETRFGIANSALYAVVTTDASCGAVNAMHDSFTPLGGMVTMVNMQLGELIFGGVGAGLYGVLIMVVLTVFIAGLMVGRTPEYLGKRIQQREVQMAMLYVLAFPLVVLILTALSVVVEPGLAGLNNRGPHGLSEILYAFTSTTSNNGSAFAGLTGSTTYYNTLFGVATLLGRFALIVPVLALAGFLAERRAAPATAGTFPVTGPLFVVLLLGVILIIGALTFFPVLALGPILEHLQMLSGRVFA